VSSNLFGPLYLTYQLLDVLKATAQCSQQPCRLLSSRLQASCGVLAYHSPAVPALPLLQSSKPHGLALCHPSDTVVFSSVTPHPPHNLLRQVTVSSSFFGPLYLTYQRLDVLRPCSRLQSPAVACFASVAKFLFCDLSLCYPSPLAQYPV
jgi:hypothetical protein